MSAKKLDEPTRSTNSSAEPTRGPPLFASVRATVVSVVAIDPSAPCSARHTTTMSRDIALRYNPAHDVTNDRSHVLHALRGRLSVSDHGRGRSRDEARSGPRAPGWRRDLREGPRRAGDPRAPA